jgi:hypothetical protein
LKKGKGREDVPAICAFVNDGTVISGELATRKAL